jgi:hypothetical protein
VPDPTPAQRVASAWRQAADDAASIRSLVVRPLAIGWATVDLDRATGELAASLGLPGDDPFRAGPRSAVLGGTCRIAAGVLPDGGWLVVLEPDTEGRLAGSLARFDEGPVAAWLLVEAPAPGLGLEELRRAGLTLSTEGDGPFGPEWLIADGPARAPGRHRILVLGPAGTIRP